MYSNVNAIVYKAYRLVAIGRRVRRFAEFNVVSLLATLVSCSAQAEVVSEPSAMKTDIPVVVGQSRPELGILTDIEVRRSEGAIAISGAIQVDTRTRTATTNTTPQSLKVELLDSQGTVRTMRTILLGPHGLHRRDGQMPNFDTHLDVEPLEGESFRISIDEKHSD